MEDLIDQIQVLHGFLFVQFSVGVQEFRILEEEVFEAIDLFIDAIWCTNTFQEERRSGEISSGVEVDHVIHQIGS